MTAEHLTARKAICVIAAVAAISLVTCRTVSAQTTLGLKAIGKGERVRLSYKGRWKAVDLEKDFAGVFVPGGDPPHRYTVLLSVERNSQLYLVARFRSRCKQVSSTATSGRAPKAKRWRPEFRRKANPGRYPPPLADVTDARF